MILALGIDAVIDCGKGISLAARCAHDVWEDYWAHPGVISVDPLPLGVIAAGAEIVSACSGRAVITNEEKHVRCARDYPRLNPRFALMDPSYPCSVPQVLSSGFGAFPILPGAGRSCYGRWARCSRCGAFTRCSAGTFRIISS